MAKKNPPGKHWDAVAAMGEALFKKAGLLAGAEAYGRDNNRSAKGYQKECMKFIIQGGTAKDGPFQTYIRAQKELKHLVVWGAYLDMLFRDGSSSLPCTAIDYEKDDAITEGLALFRKRSASDACTQEAWNKLAVMFFVYDLKTKTYDLVDVPEVSDSLVEEPRETDEEMKERIRKEMADEMGEAPKESKEEQVARVTRKLEAEAEAGRNPHKRARKTPVAPTTATGTSGASSSTSDYGW